MFQLTHPVWGATAISSAGKAVTLKFQSTHPVWGATAFGAAPIQEELFQSTHPVWGATFVSVHGAPHIAISIHAPRVGCDVCP